jgi:hypothetical protein
MSSFSKEQEQQRKLKKEYGQLYEAFIQILAKDDPMNLVRIGAPDNEYQWEVDRILLRLNEAKSPSKLGDIIYEAFVQGFGKSFASQGEQSYRDYKPRFEALGEVAWKAWERWKEEKEQE